MVELALDRTFPAYTFMSLPAGDVTLFMCARDMWNLRSCEAQPVTLTAAVVTASELEEATNLLAQTKAAGDSEATTVLAVQQAAVRYLPPASSSPFPPPPLPLSYSFP